MAIWLVHIKHSLWVFDSVVMAMRATLLHERNLICCHGKCIISWRLSAAAVLLDTDGFNSNSSTLNPWWLLSKLFLSTLNLSGFAVFTFRLSGVSPGAVKICVATPLSDGLYLTPERVQAEFVGVLLLILGGWRVRPVCVLSCCLVLRAGPGLHAHLGGAGISGADIDTRKEITRVHASQRAQTQRHIQTREERWRLRRCGWMDQLGEPKEKNRQKEWDGGRAGVRSEMARADTKGGLYCSCKM